MNTENKTQENVSEIKLVPKKKTKVNLGKLTKIFESKKKRYLFMLLFILPFIILIGVFGYIAYRDAKNLLNVVTGEVEVKDEHNIQSMKYQLRDNATDVQLEYFAELKEAIEGENPADDATIAGLVCKNYVADFFTWTNKTGQYDVSALYYVYTPIKDNVFLQARDGFYKYLNSYINEYGSENLIEVENVTVDKASKSSIKYEVDEDSFDAYEVTCSWKYKEGSRISTSGFSTKMNFVVIKNGNRFEIVETSKSPINIQQVEQQPEETNEAGEANE